MAPKRPTYPSQLRTNALHLAVLEHAMNVEVATLAPAQTILNDFVQTLPRNMCEGGFVVDEE
eukprot:4559251-Pleurochrysis_carterae.AAC.1